MSRTMPFADKNPLAFFDEGTNGKGVILVHGLTGAPAEMRLIGRQFNRLGYSVYAPLLAGHGKDVRTLKLSHWRNWLDSVEEAVARLAPHVDATYASGICVGGKLALMAATRRPGSLQAVALYSPCFSYDGWNISRSYSLMASQIGWLSKIPFLDRLSFHETSTLGVKDERMRRRIAGMSSEGMLDSFPGRGLVEMYQLGRQLKKELPTMQTPALIVHALEDDVSNPSNARYIHENIGGESELKLLDNSYHMIHLDRQYREVADMSAAFFEAHYVH